MKFCKAICKEKLFQIVSAKGSKNYIYMYVISFATPDQNKEREI